MKKKTLFWIIVAVQVVFLLGMIGFKQTTLWFGQKVMLKTMPYDPLDFIRGDFINIRYDISRINLTLNDETYKRGDKVYLSLKDEGDYFGLSKISGSDKTNPYIKGRVTNINKVSKMIIDVDGKECSYSNFISSGYEPEFTEGEKVIAVFSKAMAIPVEKRPPNLELLDMNSNESQLSYVRKCEDDCKPYNDNWNIEKNGVVKSIDIISQSMDIELPIQSYFVPKGTGNFPELNNGKVMVEAYVYNGDAIVSRLFVNGMPYDFRAVK